ncbi:hypothetical protein OH77DRAFT_891443 [Trametes cingulata]|nr:hypothetical protein OH77DRAFT_891443 [Trametes cingulata]
MRSFPIPSCSPAPRSMCTFPGDGCTCLNRGRRFRSSPTRLLSSGCVGLCAPDLSVPQSFEFSPSSPARPPGTIRRRSPFAPQASDFYTSHPAPHNLSLMSATPGSGTSSGCNRRRTDFLQLERALKFRRWHLHNCHLQSRLLFPLMTPCVHFLCSLLRVLTPSWNTIMFTYSCL